jgi:hypothetical protein
MDLKRLPTFTQTGSNEFAMILLRRGQTLQKWQYEADPQVVAIHGLFYPDETPGPFRDFYSAFGDNTARKILRCVFDSPKTRDQLLSILSVNPIKLDQTLTFFTACRIFEHEGGIWRKGADYTSIDNLGPTLEWYVARYYRWELQAEARHSVVIDEVPGGDLDVVAFLGDVEIYVECKSGAPKNIEDGELRHFLQRAWEFNPEIAVLLLDSTDAIPSHLIYRLNDIYYDLDTKEGMRGDGTSLHTPGEAPHLEPQPRYGSGIYWGAHNIYVVNVRKSISESLKTVHRHYFGEARHRTQWFPKYRWDFVNGTVHREAQPPSPHESE